LVQVKDPWQNTGLEAIFQLEVAREMLLEKLVEFGLNVIRGAAICERKVIILGVNREILSDNVVKLVNHGGKGLDLVGVNLFNLF